MPDFSLIDAVPASDVADNDTITFAYPSGKAQADYDSDGDHHLWIEAHQSLLDVGADTFSISFGGSNITVTYKGSTTIAGGTRVSLQAALVGEADLTAATGTASDTIADVTGTFSQTVLNNNFKSLADKVNAILAALRSDDII